MSLALSPGLFFSVPARARSSGTTRRLSSNNSAARRPHWQGDGMAEPQGQCGEEATQIMTSLLQSSLRIDPAGPEA
eukprot:CAMPEP_0175780740 /NCGR_PEP_ID=MMETSP0097-20121207/76908_1 /TAXON_ID=311494 /ORGANISM="Alexandrium monilatum, Strain CCMP3105" /LENGTH=75 /DNA_ID=CAMNT_0017091509 /DNA_START=8 /DNA_END=232 /DNA_ORIENTATION=-